MIAADPELAASLERLLGEPVHDLHRLTGGASRQTWSLRAGDAEGTGRRLVLQRNNPGAARGMRHEVEALRAAAAAGMPVPRVLHSGEDPALQDGPEPSVGAAYLLMEAVEGETIPRRILRDDAFGEARARLGAQCGEALAHLHRLPTGAVPSLAYQDELALYEQVYRDIGVPRAAIELGLRQLAATRPSSSGRSIVHGDFRMGNLIVGPEGLRAVLDWELSHIGDPLEDLGWFCVRAWRFGSPPEAGGVASIDAFVAAYEEAGGITVDRDALRWHQALGTLRWAVICMVQAQTHLTNVARSVELAAIGRRVGESEHDLLALLRAGRSSERSSADTPEPSPGTTSPDWPDAAALVEAVRDFLTDDVMTSASGRTRYLARVSANVLAMVERELRDAGSAAHAQNRAWHRLGFATESEVCAAIRAGALDDRLDDVADDVAIVTAQRLAITNPNYRDAVVT